MKKAWLIGFCLFVLSTFVAQAQNDHLLVKADRKSPAEFFYELSLQSGVNIIYNDDLVERLPPITLELKGVSVDEILSEVLKGTDVGYRYIGDQVILYQVEPAQSRYTISGMITDSASGEPLISAFVYDEISQRSTLTNEYGYYSLSLPAGDVRLISGYLGYVSHKQNIYLNKSRIIHQYLKSSGLLPTIIVRADRKMEEEITPHVERITLSELQSNVQLGGSNDLYRAADFIPGVHTGTDGVGGIHVRGGENDQNLILMDGVPVYHPNHLLGIISVFNYQVLQQASIYKANFPSKFSGRLSSVMDVRTREGNINKWGFSGNVGISEAGFMIEGPIVKEKLAMLATSRFFLPGLFMHDISESIKHKNGVEGFADVDYFDFNGKINWKLGQRDRMYLSMYRGSDIFSDYTVHNKNEVDIKTGIRIVSKEEFDKNLNWSNRTAVFRWNHILNDKIFTNLILSTSSFVLQSIDKSKFNFTFPQSNLSSISGFDTKEFKSSITDVTAKLEMDIRPSVDHQISAGLYGIQYLFKPKSISHNEESKVGNFFLEEGLLNDNLFTGFEVEAYEAGAYFEDKWDINPKFQLTSGIHISSFFVQNTYYLDPQLRMTFDYTPSEKFAFSMGYSRMVQYLHHLTSSSIGLPTDLWVPTTSKVSPALSDQYSIAGLWRKDEYFSMDLSLYTKSMRSLISYQEGASFLLAEGPLAATIVDAGNWESRVTEGTGDASGIELQCRYDRAKWQIKLNGTWSRSFRQFDDINDGKPFPDRYDRRWSSTLSGNWKIDSKWSASANFIYGTGMAITLAESKFFNPGSFFPVLGLTYPGRNNFRLPPYHRLDVTVHYQLSAGGPFSHSLALNLYNVYNRTNPFYITLVENPATNTFEFRQISLFRFFPSISYKFSFQ